MSTSASPNGAPPRGALLQRIDALIRRDQKPAGIAGRVAVGVKRRSGGCEWLIAEFGERTATRWTTNFPEFDAALGLDEEGSMELLAGKTPGPQRLCVKTGDLKLLDAFLERYFGAPNAPTLFSLRLRGAL